MMNTTHNTPTPLRAAPGRSMSIGTGAAPGRSDAAPVVRGALLRSGRSDAAPTVLGAMRGGARH